MGRNGGRSPGKKKQRRQRGAAGGSIAEQPELGSSRCHRGGCRPEKGDFSMFRTKSALTSRQNSFLSSRKENGPDLNHAVGVPGSAGTDDRVNKSVPAGMYFAALRGPELDQVRDCEDILLPKGEVWPFLLRFPIGCFGMCLGLGSQAILWRALASSPAMAFLHVTPDINLVLWLLALAVFVFVSITYILKCVFYFEAICREYYHPVRVNFFFAPWIACMFLAIGAPARLAPKQPHPAIWCTLIAPVFVLELKIYGQWLSGGQRRLCKVANPSCHLSVVGNFVGAILAAKVGWEEAGKLLWAVGLAHYLCLFVTPVSAAADHPGLAQGAAPRVLHVYCDAGGASIAWSAIYGSSTPWRGPSTSSPSSSTAPSSCASTSLEDSSKQLPKRTQESFFPCASLSQAHNRQLLKRRFSVAWWSYTFPMTTASVATINYAERGPMLLHQGPGGEPFGHILDHGVSVALLHPPPRIGLAILVPQ
ncbi:hypothetical protein MUK42_17253 [Musa troglodytarum]|uniref:Uncharacterized protein n=2 Tax=Musa troglodytarum TaxID=320322 RepID=A0A9E7HWC6_9LILI|nr:hypothetical protein MUK42_17253 [Musa troglodytarum]